MTPSRPRLKTKEYGNNIRTRNIFWNKRIELGGTVHVPGTLATMSKKMELIKDRIEIFSDVRERDGIGIEVIRNNETVLEIFRDDTKKSRTITVFKKEVDLDIVEMSIQKFKNEIPWEFIEDKNE